MKRVLFDFDGTLADTFDLALHLVLPKVRPYNISKKEAAHIMKHKGIEWFVQHYHIPRWRLLLGIIALRYQFSKQVHKVRLFPGIHTVIQKLQKKGINIDIVSSNSVQNIKRILKQSSVEVDSITQSSLFGKSKAIQKILRKHNTPKENAVYIGDEIRDATASKRVGVPMIAVTWGYQSKQLLQSAQPTKIVHKVSDLPSAIDNLLN